VTGKPEPSDTIWIRVCAGRIVSSRTLLENVWFVSKESNTIAKLSGPTIQALLPGMMVLQPGSAFMASSEMLPTSTRYVTKEGGVGDGMSVAEGAAVGGGAELWPEAPPELVEGPA